MLSIKELRDKCQGSKIKYDTWYGKHFARKVSIYLTFVFIKLGFSANTVTGLFLFSGIVSAILFSLGSRTSMLAGALVLQLWYILDHSDGEVARYRDEVSLTGSYFDYLTHYIVHPLVFIGLGWGFLKSTGNMGYLLSGITGAFGMMICGLISDLKEIVAYRSKKVYPGADIIRGQQGKKVSTSLASRIFSAVYIAVTFPVIMNTIAVFSLVDFLFRIRITAAVLVFYSVLISMIWVLRMIVIISKRRVDAEINISY